MCQLPSQHSNWPDPATAAYLYQPESAFQDSNKLQPETQAQLTLALSFLNMVRRLAATKLLMFKLQTLDHTHSVTLSMFWVAHEAQETIRLLVDHHLRIVSEASNSRITGTFIAYDGAHHR